MGYSVGAGVPAARMASELSDFILQGFNPCQQCFPALHGGVLDYGEGA